MFHSAHHFTLENPTLIDQHIYSGGDENPMNKLMGHSIRGVELDSSERDPPPRCHPGTRISILEESARFFQDPKPPERILWLYGPAGVGKSAIVQTVAESLKSLRERPGSDANHSLGAVIFFSRPNQRDDPKLVFTSIAYQLAARYPFYRQYIARELSNDPMMLDQSIPEQFRRLIGRPFGDQGLYHEPGSLVIMLDGLDECNLEREQVNIVLLISQFAVSHPSVPLLWLISSRPEPHLRDVFLRIDVLPSYRKQEVPVDYTESCRDVERYLWRSFAGIRQRHPDHFSENTSWPTASQFLVVCTAASGLFAFAAAIVRFISDAECGSPISQLEEVLLVIDKKENKGDRPRINPFSTLDALYTRVLSSVPETILPTTVRILQQLLCMPHSPFTDLANFLGLAQHEAYIALQKLHSILFIPSPHLVQGEKIRAYHASFTDFLRDDARSGRFCIKVPATIEDHIACSLRILTEVTTDLNTITLSWPAQGASLEVVRSRLLTHALKSLSINFLSVPEDVQQKFLMTIVDSFMKLDLIQISFVVVSPRLFLSFLKGILTFARSRGSLKYGLTKLIPLSELDRSAINPQALAYVLCRESGPEGFTSMGSRDFMLRTVSREYWKPSDKSGQFVAFNKATTGSLHDSSMHQVMADIDFLRLSAPSKEVIVWGAAGKRVVVIQQERSDDEDAGVKQEWIYIVPYP